jgi:hypothetical protein
MKWFSLTLLGLFSLTLAAQPVDVSDAPNLKGINYIYMNIFHAYVV